MKTITSLLLIVLFLAGCGKETEQQREQVVNESGEGAPGLREQQEADTLTIIHAVAVLQSAKGNNISGIVAFEKTGTGIKITTKVSGLKPGKHGFHIHEFGDLSAPDFTSAGGHFSPLKNEHGAPTAHNRHEGDMGNIEADENGNAVLEWTDDRVSFQGPNSILGRAVIVHENPDDYTTQPTGNAGGRVAGGIIGIAKK